MSTAQHFSQADKAPRLSKRKKGRFSLRSRELYFLHRGPKEVEQFRNSYSQFGSEVTYIWIVCVMPDVQ